MQVVPGRSLEIASLADSAWSQRGSGSRRRSLTDFHFRLEPTWASADWNDVGFERSAYRDHGRDVQAGGRVPRIGRTGTAPRDQANSSRGGERVGTPGALAKRAADAATLAGSV